MTAFAPSPVARSEGQMAALPAGCCRGERLTHLLRQKCCEMDVPFCTELELNHHFVDRTPSVPTPRSLEVTFILLLNFTPNLKCLAKQ